MYIVNSHLTRLFVTYDSTKKQPPPKLCKNCAHFRVNPTYPTDLKMGKCVKEVKINLIDGAEISTYAEVVREYDCKGNWYQEKEE